MDQTVLAGCTPTPLASYLKALGVLRLLSKSYPAVRAAWRNERFALFSGPSPERLEQFFLNDYCPTPVVAPWNGGSGFYFQERKSKDKDPTTGKRIKLGVRDQPTEATRTVDALASSMNKRYSAYRAVIQLCRDHVGRLGLEEAPESGPQKDRFVLLLRGSLPEDCLEWIDASLLITSEGTQFPPLLGTGGNDGNLDFTSNFMQCLLGIVGTNEDAKPMQSAAWLHMSLFGQPAWGLLKNSIGQFSPGQAGGPNATTGFEAGPSINPWDFVLMVEGAIAFAAAAVRRNANDPEGVLSYPFTVRAVSAGAGNLGEGDSGASRSRGELWMPLWRKPASYSEIRALLAEGRVALGKKPARDALDFVRAVHRLGGYRGIDSFQRYGLLKRNGKNYLATPLARIKVNSNPKAEWVDELDQHNWLTRFRRFAQGDSVPRRFLASRKQLEDMLFELVGRALAPPETQKFLTLLGDIQLALATSGKARESVPPVPRLSERWVQAADDGTAAFRIARALAGLTGTQGVPLPLRAQLFPIHPMSNRWIEDARKAKGAADDLACRVRLYTERKGNLPDTLIGLLGRRLWLAEEFDLSDKPLRSLCGVGLDDLFAFLRSDHMDRRVATLLSGLSLCSIPQDIEHTAGEGTIPAAFALLKLVFTPDTTLRSLGLMGETDHFPVPAGLVAQLAAGNADNRAVRLAWRRMRVSGLAPLFVPTALPELNDLVPRRAAAALLIPLRFGATSVLARSVLAMPEIEIA